MRLLPASAAPPVPGAAQLADLRRRHGVLAEPRAMARFLCGLGSPALARARLTRDPGFGALADADFRTVLAAVAA